ncbi:RagB/SusD family nutrient uptake outer membrane protein [Flavitalea sp. BT771]|uniref:RagB/SusD family nutrient uptake outer membrane protein n=1 Tax=Flavitalea sp. BT771 TaxID=3063329 RepID=UPI0026E3B3C4|nr:RagB/SusD family nutrient uptake outer membrane protein [Flavitalea sp. BT771]MDO6435134.1 RagB/SusD family nutrient uptake outer membrane protein [Flavitalea sp. BT771]MDV6224161.1 RagB/SusD family nutrient uptake outer membrane protein [Flavitalea sp. BT771]
MQQQLNRNTLRLLALLFVMGGVACKKDYAPEGAAPKGAVLNNVKALTSVAIGLQQWYTSARTGLVYTRVTASGLLTGEIYVVNPGNTDEAQLGTGGNAIPNTNGMVTGIWTVSNKIIFDADNIMNNLDVVTVPGYASGLVAYASIFKALALGDMAMFYDHVPDTTGANVHFITSAEAYTKAVAVLDKALAAIAANPVTANFLSSVPAGIDITNTLYALKARYALLAGDNATALDAAGKVNLSVRSVFNYSATFPNPIFSLAASTNNIFQPVDSAMGLPAGLTPDAADKREPFYIAVKSSPRFRIAGFDTALLAGRPIYLPGEIMLIKAEAYTRQDDLTNGLDQLNGVVTKQPSADLYKVGAALPAIAGPLSKDDLLTQIYRNRCIELFMSGLKLADEKRFGRPDSERKRSYLPFPYVERNGNPNTPVDPVF